MQHMESNSPSVFVSLAFYLIDSGYLFKTKSYMRNTLLLFEKERTEGDGDPETSRGGINEATPDKPSRFSRSDCRWRALLQAWPACGKSKFYGALTPGEVHGSREVAEAYEEHTPGCYDRGHALGNRSCVASEIHVGGSPRAARSPQKGWLGICPPKRTLRAWRRWRRFSARKYKVQGRSGGRPLALASLQSRCRLRHFASNPEA